MDASVVDIIDMADNEGMYSFSVRRLAVQFDTRTRGTNILRELLRFHFCTFTTCSMKAEGVSRWTEGIDATASVSERGDWTVRLNLAKYFRLPALHPKAELLELKDFLESMKPFFEEHVNSRTVVDLFANSKQTVELECKYPGAVGFKKVDQVHTNRLRRRIQDSQVLQTFFRNLLTSGHSIGPWVFGEIREAMLFGLNDGPAMRQFMEELRAPEGYYDRHEQELVAA
jgi:hypothetical protein